MSANEIVRIPILPFNMVNAHLIRSDAGCIAGHADKPIPAAKDDWLGVVVAPLSTDTEDPANAGIRREPELREHEDIITAPRKPAQEFDLPDDEGDDDAQRLRVLQRQVRATARQVSLDPADAMGL